MAIFCILLISIELRPHDAVLSNKGMIKYRWSSSIMISNDGRILIASYVSKIRSLLLVKFCSASKSACLRDCSIRVSTSGKIKYMCEKSFCLSSGLLISYRSLRTYFGWIWIIKCIISKMWSANLRTASGSSLTINETMPNKSCVRYASFCLIKSISGGIIIGI